VIVIVFATGVMTYIMVSVVPKFEEAFRSLGGKLPTITQTLISISRFLAEKFWMIGLAVILIVVAFFLIRRTKKGRRGIDRAKLGLWIFGPIIGDTQVARFARTLGTLSSSGVVRLRSLDNAARASARCRTRCAKASRWRARWGRRSCSTTSS
jgi:type II secretory pathway component PulF